jgi:hypothetical protein
LTLPDAGLIYLDANCLIYSVEHIEPYDPLLQQVWRRGGVITSELSLLEVLVKPFKAKDRLLQTSYRELLKAPEVKRLIPLTAISKPSTNRDNATIWPGSPTSTTGRRRPSRAA